MKTAVIMRRELFGNQISQHSQTEFFSMTDLVMAGNQWRVANKLQLFNHSEWFQRVSTKEFMAELEAKFGPVKINSKGRGHHTWVHPLLFIDMALAISPQLKIEVYEWIYDQLIRFRNDSGDSYKRMCGALYMRASNKMQFSKDIVRVAHQIQEICGVDNWQIATEDQLKKRDKCHDNIALLADVLDDFDEAVRLGLLQAQKLFNQESASVQSGFMSVAEANQLLKENRLLRESDKNQRLNS